MTKKKVSPLREPAGWHAILMDYENGKINEDEAALGLDGYRAVERDLIVAQFQRHPEVSKNVSVAITNLEIMLAMEVAQSEL